MRKMNNTEKIDNKGLRTHCPKCGIRLQRRKSWKSETCGECGKKVSYNPLDDLPYHDTNVPVEQSQAEIKEFLRSMGLKRVTWGEEYHDLAVSHILAAQFEDGTGFQVSLPAIPETGDGIQERQVMRIFYHYIKAISVIHQMGILSRAEMMLGLLKVGETNLGSVVNTDQMIETMGRATRLLGGSN